MSKKQDFLRSEQSRDKHPERLMKGSAAQQGLRGGQAKGNPEDFQQPGTGKVANDSNKQGETAPTQKNEAQRTPESRHDRENHLGSSNQVNSRRGVAGGGQK